MSVSINRRRRPLRTYLIVVLLCCGIAVGCNQPTKNNNDATPRPSATQPAPQTPQLPPPQVLSCSAVPACHIEFPVPAGGTVWQAVVGQLKAHPELVPDGNVTAKVIALLNDARKRLPWWTPEKVPPGGGVLRLAQYGKQLEPYPLHDADYYLRQLKDRVNAAGPPQAKHDEYFGSLCSAYTELAPSSLDPKDPAGGVLSELSNKATEFYKTQKPFDEEQFKLRDRLKLAQHNACL